MEALHDDGATLAAVERLLKLVLAAQRAMPAQVPPKRGGGLSATHSPLVPDGLRHVLAVLHLRENSEDNSAGTLAAASRQASRPRERLPSGAKQLHGRPRGQTAAPWNQAG